MEVALSAKALRYLEDREETTVKYPTAATTPYKCLHQCRDPTGVRPSLQKPSLPTHLLRRPKEVLEVTAVTEWV